MSPVSLGVGLIALGAIAGMLLRPRGIAEVYWASGGALLLLVLGWVTPTEAWQAVARGTDVYLFLAGMMLLSELARVEGVFDWVADAAARRARGSPARLLWLVYLAGGIITALLSNDATAVVLTPAVLAAVRRARVEPGPPLLACAFIANAASFVLPISNPANLVVFGRDLPPLLVWLRHFALPSAAAIGVTYLVLRWRCRRELKGICAAPAEPIPLTPRGRAALYGLICSGLVLLVASGIGIRLGVPTLVAAALTVAAVSGRAPDRLRTIAAGVSWSVIPLVAALFILVAALQAAGGLALTTAALRAAARQGMAGGIFSLGFGVGLLANVMNNLPVGLISANAVAAAHPAAPLTSALLVGVDLGPNLSVTGSLATILWLIALRRDGVRITAGQFLRVGAWAMPLALAAALAALLGGA